ncbi:MAG: hypothetical protein AMJ66_01140 [Betaproteobacteria bacterium SG8_40]|nr:MAG: hypothetical protein AMJ66_01140 [Betaproteobacteria bacterium SG8_40]
MGEIRAERPERLERERSPALRDHACTATSGLDFRVITREPVMHAHVTRGIRSIAPIVIRPDADATCFTTRQLRLFS